MKYYLRIQPRLLSDIREDLSRPHPFAAERVGFVSCRAAKSEDGSLIIYAYGYEAVADNDYMRGGYAGATIGPDAIRRALEIAFEEGKRKVSIFHIHSHIGGGIPGFSLLDQREQKKFVPDFFHSAPNIPHGALLLNEEAIYGNVWTNEKSGPIPFNTIMSVGSPVEYFYL